jgi:hypothetical protein
MINSLEFSYKYYIELYYLFELNLDSTDQYIKYIYLRKYKKNNLLLIESIKYKQKNEGLVLIAINKLVSMNYIESLSMIYNLEDLLDYIKHI